MRSPRVLACCILGLIAAAVLFPVLWTNSRYDTQFRDQPDAPPSEQFPLGTDHLGRDRWSRLLHAGQVSLGMAPLAAGIACLLAALIGGGAGLAGGGLEKFLMAAVDLFLIVPWMFLLLTVRSLLPLNTGPWISAVLTFALLGLLGWPGGARVACASVRTWKTSGFLLYARAGGLRPWRLLVRHTLPNLLPVMRAQFWSSLPNFVLAETTLGILGLGVPEPLPSLGGMLRDVNPMSATQEPWVLAPAILLVIVLAGMQILHRSEVTV